MSKTTGKITRKELEESLQVSRRTVTNWIQKGCPVEIIANRQYFDLEAVKEWTTANIEAANSESGTDKMQAARLKVLQLKAEYEQIRIDQLKGKLVELAEVKSQNVKKATVIKAGLNKLKSRLYQLEGKPLNEMEIIFEDWIKEILGDWANA